jgi:hypothetical protein
LPPNRGIATRNTGSGDAEATLVAYYDNVTSTRSGTMSKLRMARTLYLLGVLAAFAVAAGADRKFG